MTNQVVWTHQAIVHHHSDLALCLHLHLAPSVREGVWPMSYPEERLCVHLAYLVIK